MRKIIEHAHALAEWVVSYDRLSSRAMLADAGIKVIRDVAVPGSEARILVSSREPSSNLLRVVRRTFAGMPNSELAQEAGAAADRAIATVVNACGQKVMAAGRSAHAALEIIGLAGSIALVNGAPETAGRAPIWFSLDDSRSILGLRGEIADALAVSIRGSAADGFSVLLTVVEAKCVAGENAAVEAQSSLKQLRSTCLDLRSKLVEQTDHAARRGWGVDLLAFFAGKPEFAQAFRSPMDREAFERALLAGDVAFDLIGRSVVVVHDDEASGIGIATEPSPDDPRLVQHRLGQRSLAALILSLGDAARLPCIPSVAVGANPDLPIATDPPSNTIPPSSQPETPLDGGSLPGAGPDLVHPDYPFDFAQLLDELSTPATPKEDDGGASISHDTPRQDPGQSPTSGASHPTFPPELARLLAEISTASGDPSREVAGDAEAAQVAQRLQAAFVDFGMRAEFSSRAITITPNGFIVRFRGNSLLTIKKIEARRSELRTTHGLDVVDVREGLGEIGIFVARRDRQTVGLARLWLDTMWPATAPRSLNSFLIGVREDNGAPLWMNLDEPYGGHQTHAPHTLIAGETGSGKGVLTQNLLLQMVALNDPRNLSLRLIDPKFGVDYFWVAEAPHLQGGIVSTQDDARAVLGELVAEMDRRYALLVAQRVPNLKEYNAKVAASERLPRIILIHDEMADWMASSEEYRDLIKETMTRLAAKARACGINIVMITQRAAQDAIPVGIRDNLGNRLCLKVASEGGSMLALKSPGAERLLGKGHVAANLSGDRPTDSDVFLAQTPFASTADLDRLGAVAIASWSTQRGS